MKSILAICFLLIATTLSSQKLQYPVSTIPDSLRTGANAIVRIDQTDIIIASQRSMTIKNKRVVTVFNENGFSAIQAVEHYDKKTSVKSIEATVFDLYGNEIKKIKRKDFKDQSAIGEGTVFSDSRVIYLDYTATQYPYTIIYESEVETSNTAFIPQWFPLNNYFVSLEKAVLNVTFPNTLGFKKKESNFSSYKIEKTVDTPTQLSYTAVNFPVQKQEAFSSSKSTILPNVMLGLELFHLEGVDGNAKTWTDFGKWYSEKILEGTLELSDDTKAKIKAAVGNEKDLIKKAKIVYAYVQHKSRYVSIQVGIGGWKPMLAKDVDRLGYGDCKALTNYTKALLSAVDVPSYNTILYGDPGKMDIDSNFVSMQGNHMILSIPDGSNYIFLECTSQDDPFGYQANFTDDRNVLIIKPEGGEIVRTKIYQNQDNSQISKGQYSLSGSGDLAGSVSIISSGAQYGQKYRYENLDPTEKEAHYKEYWDNINNLKIIKTTFTNDKEKISFTENAEIAAQNYGSILGNKIIFAVNVFNNDGSNIKRSRNRKTAFEIQRGFYDEDEIKIELPLGFAIEALPADYNLTGKFGEYKTLVIKTDAGHLIYNRSLFLKKGLYLNTEFEEFRLFMEQIARNDNAKIILNKN